MKSLWLMALLNLLTMGDLAAAVERLPPEFASALRSADSVVLYSLEPHPEIAIRVAQHRQDFERAERLADLPMLSHYAVLGQVTLQGEEMLAAVREFERAVEVNDDGAVSMCFDPRHALRVEQNGQVFELVQCYECGRMYLQRDGEVIARLRAGGSSKALDALMRGHGLELSVVF